MGESRDETSNPRIGETAMKAIRHFRDPDAERYALTDQIRRSSRSVCANIAEAWRKRRYTAAFISKLSDSEGGAAETQVHMEFAFRHGYIGNADFEAINDAYEHILGQLVRMIDRPEKWVIGSRINT
jgi:four helix bundle protein